MAGKYGLVFAAIAGLTAAGANAQATRTWVSGVGDDANPCSRTAPCKTFAGAISKTAAGGEINCIDPGGFGAVTITKSLTIDCRGVLASILGTGVNGVTVNGAGVDVTLRNISINGGGSGIHGVRVVNARSVNIDDVTIFGFGAPTGSGISVAGDGAAVHVVDTAIHGNARGLIVKPTGSAVVTLIDSTLTSNAGEGLSAEGSGARLWVGGSTIAGNGVGIKSGGGASIQSYGDNRVDANATNGSFTGNAPLR